MSIEHTNLFMLVIYVLYKIEKIVCSNKRYEMLTHIFVVLRWQKTQAHLKLSANPAVIFFFFFLVRRKKRKQRESTKVDWKIIHALAVCLNSLAIKCRYLCKLLISSKRSVRIDTVTDAPTHIACLIQIEITKSFSKFT